MKRALALCLILLTLSPPPVRAQDLNVSGGMSLMFEAMMEAMLAFMDRIRDPWGGYGRNWGGPSSWSSPYGGWPGSTPWSSMPGTTPWSSMPGTTPWSYPGGMSPWSSMPGSSPWSSMPGSSPWSSMPGSSPWSSFPGSNPWSVPGAGSPWSANPWSVPGVGSPWSSMPNGNPWNASPWNYGSGPWGNGPAGRQGAYPPRLNGAWMGENGEVLWLGDGNFRLTDGRGGEARGALRYSTAGYLSLQPSRGQASNYEYGVLDDVLALRDSSGQTLYFRRVPSGYRW